MTRIYILLITILFIYSCRPNNHSEGLQVRQAIIQENMLPSFQNYGNIIARDAEYYMITMRYPITFYFSLSVDGKSSDDLLYLCDSLMRHGITNPEQVTDSIRKETEKIVNFMYKNAIKNFFYSDKSVEGNFALEFIICNDGVNSCKEFESLSFHRNPLQQAKDTVIIDTTISELKIFKQFDLHWVSTKWRPNQRLKLTE